MKQNNDIRTLKQYSILIGLCWLLFLAGSLLWNSHQFSHSVKELAMAEARTHFIKDQIYRHWTALHGGVYVPVDSTTKPNPYLSHIPDRDVTTTSGKTLTLVNPAYMTRQVNDIGGDLFGVRGHITSLKPFNPINVASPWEIEALNALAKGEKEHVSFTCDSSGEVLRFMQPMITQKACLKCHSIQGYTVGDVRGGVSFVIPMSKYEDMHANTFTSLFVIHSLSLILGILFLYLGYRHIKINIMEKDAALKEISDNEAKLEKQNAEYLALNETYEQTNQELQASNEKIMLMNNALIASQQNAELSENRFKTFINNSPISIIITGIDGTIRYVSPLSVKIIGFSENMLLDKHISSFVHPDDTDKFKKKWVDIRHSKTDIKDFEYRIIDSKQQQRWVSHSASFIVENDGGSSIQHSLYNISHTKAIEDELIYAKEAAIENDKQKSAFLANMSHEIRTPMNGILGFSNRLLKPNISEAKREEYVKIINNCGNQLLSLIDDLIDIAKIEANQLSISRKDININEILDELHSIFSTRTQQTGVNLILTKALKDNDSFAETDGVRLRQILSNLLNNAVKFTQEGSISFGYVYCNTYIEFFVEDTGIGIEPEKQLCIFDRFRQADSTISQNFGGSGLGLSISKALVELLDGHISVQSTLGKGTRFTFTIPFSHSPITLEQEAATGEHEHSQKAKKAIVAEDDESNFILLYEILTEMGFDIIRARDGSQAVLFFAENPDVDIIMMDIKMPILNGCEATKQIRKFDMEVPIIAQTAYIHIFDKECIEEAGCNDVIAKPISHDDLRSAILKNLRRS